MVISAKMITFDFNHQNSTQFEISSSNSTDIFYFDKEKHFENITCKISLLASFLTLVSLTWVIYLFISKSYCRLKPHLYTFILINVQLLLSIIEIIWNYLSISSNNYIKFYRIYFTSQMLLTLITRCLSITIILSILQILNVTERLASENFQTIKKIYAKLINSVVLKYIIAFILPLIATFLFILLENFNQDKENNIMIIRFNSKQTYVYLILLSLIIILNLYCLFTYTRYDHYFVNKRNESDINDETDNAEDPLISNNDSVVSTEQFHIREPLVDNDYSLDGKY